MAVKCPKGHTDIKVTFREYVECLVDYIDPETHSYDLGTQIESWTDENYEEKFFCEKCGQHYQVEELANVEE